MKQNKTKKQISLTKPVLDKIEHELKLLESGTYNKKYMIETLKFIGIHVVGIKHYLGEK